MTDGECAQLFRGHWDPGLRLPRPEHFWEGAPASAECDAHSLGPWQLRAVFFSGDKGLKKGSPPVARAPAWSRRAGLKR